MHDGNFIPIVFFVIVVLRLFKSIEINERKGEKVDEILRQI